LELLGVETTVVDRLTNRLEVARTIATKVVLSDELEGLKDSAGFDLVVECTGMPAVWEQAVSYLRRGGRLILFGGCPNASRVCYSAERLHYDEITLMGSFHFSPDDVRRAYQLITEGKIRLNGLISGTFKLEDIARAFELLREGQGIKYAIVP
jgi:L-iditol 2-dehydrogenase